jgi:N-acetylmuramoyl-L-alanine amidase
MKRVCIDAGHGYKKNKPTGARANGVVEDDLAKVMALKLKWYLTQRGVKVILTRSNDNYVTLQSRAALAKREKCDCFVSIHVNAAGNVNACGVEAMVAEGDMRSLPLAEAVMDVLRGSQMRDRGVKWDSQSQHSSLYVLRNTYKHMPAVLVELGFCTHVPDAARMSSRVWQEGVAAGIAKVIADYK